MMKDANYPEAQQLFLSYKKYDPKEESTYYNLALIYQKTGRNDLAIAELKNLLRLNPSDADAQSLLNELTGKATTKIENDAQDK
jgi:tetratricopeptide (TPR) repeat protein